MSNSYFNFVEAPDYSTALRDGFNTFNASADRAEQLERLNDETREKNAGVPLKVLESIIEFSPKAAAMAEGLREKRFKKNVRDGFTKEGLEKAQEGWNALMNLGKKGNKLKNAALENKDSASYELFEGDFGKPRTLDNYINKTNRGAAESLTIFAVRELPAGPQKASDLDRITTDWATKYIDELEAQGVPSKLIAWKVQPVVDQIKANWIKTQQEALSKKNVQAEQVRITEEVVDAFNSGDPNKINEVRDYNASFYGGNKATGTRALLEIGLVAVQKKMMPVETLESYAYSESKVKGDKLRSIIEKLGGGPESTVWANTFLTNLDAAKKTILDDVDKENNIYDRSYENKFLKFRGSNPDTPPTQEEIATYIYRNPETKYDFTRTGRLPEDVKRALSEEAQDDAAWLPTVQKKARLKTLTQADVNKLNSSDLRNQYQNSVVSSEIGASGTYIAIGKSAATRIASQVTGEKEGDTTRSIKWGNINDQVELLYPSVYASKLSDAKPVIKDGVVIKTAEMVAHGAAQDDLLERAQNGEFDTWGEYTQNTQAKITAVEHIKSGGETKEEREDWLNNNIIAGTERALKEAQSFPEGSTQTATLYKQIGNDLGIPGHILQAIQLEAAANLEGKGLPVKSAITLAYEKMSDKEKKLLNKVTPARLARMKFEAFMNTPEGGEEGVITYDEMLALHPDVIAFNKQTEKLNQQATAEKDAQLKPKKGDWKRLPKGVNIKFDGTNWKQVGMTFGRGNEYQGDLEGFYIDKDLIRRFF